MEHEDNAHLDNYLSSQHLMENLQMASGGVGGVCGDVGGLVGAEEIGGIGNIGGKFEEHDEQDDGEEWKYIKEVQQSEKQQTQSMKVNDGTAVVEGVGNSNGNVDAGDELLLLGRHEHEAGDGDGDDGDGFGNGVADVVAAVAAHGAGVCVAVDEEGEVEIIKNDGDFSTTSNTTSTAGEEYADDGIGVLQVEMKIEAPEPMAQQLHAENMAPVFGGAEETEEEEPSSLATNTTNGTNSLSENAPPQQLHEEEQQHVNDFDMDDKENADPLMVDYTASRPTDLNFEAHLHTQLNPDAMEFVPSFGSNPASPTVPQSDSAFGNQLVGEPAFDAAVAAADSAVEQPEILQPHPSAMARHLLGDDIDDDLVAQSPRKGRGESNMDSIALPPQTEFEHEVAKRPHELEQEDNLLGDVPSKTPDSHMPIIDGLEANSDLLEADAITPATVDAMDFQRHSPASFIDHGPETSVDLDAEIDEQPIEVLKQTEMMTEKADSIEQLLNTVQPLPLDSESLNTSFVEEPQHELAGEFGEKELLDVDEKEFVSHSPSTEEMQMNLQNELHASAKDIPQIPIDLDSAAHMQESIYLEHTSADARQQQQQQEQLQEQRSPQPQSPGPQPQSPGPQPADESLLADTSLPMECDISFEAMSTARSGVEVEHEAVIGAPPTALNIFAPEFTPTQKLAADATPSPQSTEEKHLVEETKEEAQAAAANNFGGLDELEQQMDDLILSAKDGILSQVEEVAHAATNIKDNFNPFATHDSEHKPLEFMAEQPQLNISTDQPASPSSYLFESEVKAAASVPEPELVAYQYTALSEQVAEAVKAGEPSFDSFANFAAEQTNAAFVPSAAEESTYADEPVAPLAAEEPIVVAESAALAAESVASAAEPVAHVEPVALAMESFESAAEPIALTPTPTQLGADPVELVTESGAPPAEPIVPAGELVEHAVEAVESTIKAGDKPHGKDSLVGAVAVGAIAATAAAGVTGALIKKPDASPKATSRTPTSTKPKVGEVKKSAPAKKPGTATTTTKTTATTTAAARPRTVPAPKPTTAAAGEKKPTTTARTSTTTTTRKPLTATSASKTTTMRTTTISSSARPATAPATTRSTTLTKTTAAPRPATTARHTGALTTHTAANGIASKPRPTSSAPTKPTTLGLSATAKPRLSSPRATLSSQLRKSGPGTGTTATASARSPIKSTAPTTNGTHITAKSSTTTAAGRTKTTTVTTTTTTKTFTARPAPKTTLSSTTTTRRTVPAIPSSVATTKTNSTLLKRTPPGKTSSTTTAGRLSLSPTKTPSTALKMKTKDATKKATPTKTGTAASPLKPKPTAAKTNGAGKPETPRKVERQPQLNGGGEPHLENGTHNESEQNGGGGVDHSFLLEQQQQQPAEMSLIDA